MTEVFKRFLFNLKHNEENQGTSFHFFALVLCFSFINMHDCDILSY